MATASDADRIEFVGTPRRLVAVGALPEVEGELSLEGEAAGLVSERHRALHAHALRGRRGMSLRLRPDAPPGDHQAVLRAGGQSWPVRLHVLPQVEVQMTPAGLSFTGAPGERVSCRAAIANSGNVAVELPKLAPVGIFADDGLESAFAATYADGADDFEEVFEAFHRRLREAHGGLMKLSITEGAGPLAPGASAVLEITAQLPEKLTRGRRYHGVWRTGFLNVAVKVTASK